MDEEGYLTMFYIGMLVVIGVSLALFISNNLIDDKAYKDKYLSKDFALLHDALSSNNNAANVKINLTDDERIVFDTENDCSFLVNAERNYCGRTSNEEEKRDTLKGSNLIIETKEGEVNIDAS